jgi:hypothetical protein
MKPNLQEALDRCLTRIEAGADIEACLRDQGPLAGELRPLIEAALALRDERRRLGEPSAAALSAGRARMHAARAHEGERAAGFAGWLRGLARPAALSGVAAAVAVLAAVGLTTNVFDFGATSTSAQVEGVVSRVDPGSIILATSKGPVVVSLGDKTVLRDAGGNAITDDDIIPGSLARVEADEENGEYHANNIEFEEDEERGDGAEVEFSGVVQSIDGSTIQVQARFGAATVLIDAGTEVSGTLASGVTIEVHAARQGDGTYLAREIEVKGGGGDDDGHDGEDSSGTSGSSPTPSASDDDKSGPGSTSSGSGGAEEDDDHEEDDH